jgi:hypothetical protein
MNTPTAAHPSPGPLQPTEKPGPYSPQPDPVPQPPKKSNEWPPLLSESALYPGMDSWHPGEPDYSFPPRG